MRLLKVALLMLAFALPVMGDNKPGIPIVQPEQDENPCVECGRVWDDIICGGEPTGAGWMDCEGGWIYLCDGYAGCGRIANCGQRCAIA